MRQRVRHVRRSVDALARHLDRGLETSTVAAFRDVMRIATWMVATFRDVVTPRYVDEALTTWMVATFHVVDTVPKRMVAAFHDVDTTTKRMVATLHNPDTFMKWTVATFHDPDMSCCLDRTLTKWMVAAFHDSVMLCSRLVATIWQEKAMKLTLTRRIELVSILETAADAIEKHAGKEKFLVKDKRIASRVIVELFRRHARKRNETAMLYKAWLQATRDLRAELRTAVIPAMFSVRAHAQMSFGPNSGAYRDFGFRPRKQRRQSVESKVVAVEKAAATRKARHTMGKKQRRAIRGGVPVSVTIKTR